jgi:hypothetical protein
MDLGAVTFLDVLGWKGIWLRRSASEIVGLLEELVAAAEDAASRQRGGAMTGEVQVVSISDTIVLLTAGAPEDVLAGHGLICQRLVAESIRKGIPLRGATSFGAFSSKGTILVGPAIDEAAAWHEALDWIGVVLTPTAEYKWVPTSPWLQYPKAPVKTLGNRELWCVDWWSEWSDLDELRAIFAEVGPLDTTVAAKYMNTLAFAFHVDKLKKMEPASLAVAPQKR